MNQARAGRQAVTAEDGDAALSLVSLEGRAAEVGFGAMAGEIRRGGFADEECSP